MNPMPVRLASPALTLIVMALFAAGILTAYLGWLDATTALAAPLALLAVNLVAALGTSPAFRRESALLVFHACLLAMVLLLAAGRLSYLKGHLELATGESFTGQLAGYEAGPWHRWRLADAAFTNDGFEVSYDAGLLRGHTLNRVHWTGADGAVHSSVIGDDHPLVRLGYRFYTSFNKGFAPAFVWFPKGGGRPERGTVHLPSYPMHDTRQSIEWSPPGSSSRLWTMLHIDEPLLDPRGTSQFSVPRKYRLVVRIGDDRRELQPGDAVDLADGKLVFEGLRAWMGYTVFYDWTTPWLLASCLAGALSLAWHYGRKFSTAARAEREA